MDGLDTFFQKAIESLLQHHRGDRMRPSAEELKDLDQDELDLWTDIAKSLELTKQGEDGDHG